MIDRGSDTWRELNRDCTAKIEAMRNTLEQCDLPHADAQYLRGRIAAYRDVLGLADRPAAVKAVQQGQTIKVANEAGKDPSGL